MTRHFNHTVLSLIFILVLSGFSTSLNAKADRFRAMWRDNPATTMVIAWDQINGADPVLYFDMFDHGEEWIQYRYQQRPDRVSDYKGMENHYVRLENLEPNTVYYFVVKDDNDSSKRYSFKTMPDCKDERIAIIAGGDSRNYREARISANRVVGKLRPHFVMFGGDMTAKDSSKEWQEWLSDWQKSISKDGRITPIVVTRGNHEYSNESLIELFDVPHENMYYAISFADDLIKVFTLNSLIATGGKQRNWLEAELRASQAATWKFAQYHFATRPHTSKKAERNDQLMNWSTLFFKYGVDVVVESDAHVVKSTYPIRPSTDADSEQGFIRDDVNGTVYIGEGCWGAPLRKNDDDKSWTRASGSFNQFKWIFVDPYQIEIRTVKTDNGALVGELPGDNLFLPPPRLSLWKPSSGEVIYVKNDDLLSSSTTNTTSQEPPVSLNIVDFTAATNGKEVAVSWTTRNEPRGIIFEVQRSFDGKSYETIELIHGETRELVKGNSYLVKDRGINSYLSDGLSYRLVRKIGDDMKVFAPCMVGADLKNWSVFSRIGVEDDGSVNVKYNLEQKNDVSIRVFNVKRREVYNSVYKNQQAGNFMKSINLKSLPQGRYFLVIKAGRKIIRRYQVLKI